MKKSIIWLFFFILFIGPKSFGQNMIVRPWGVTQGTYDPAKGYDDNSSSKNAYNEARAKLGKLWEERKLTFDDIDGTIYSNETFTQGTLYEDGKPIKELYARYDAYNDEIELKETLESSEVLSMAKDSKYSYVLNGEEYYYLGYKDENGETKEGYLTPLVSGNYTLYVKRMKVFKEGKEARNSFEKSFPHRFLDKIEYYASSNGEAPVFMKTKKSDVIAMFSEKDKSTIKQYIKERKINVSDDHDLVTLFTYANAL